MNKQEIKHKLADWMIKTGMKWIYVKPKTDIKFEEFAYYSLLNKDDIRKEAERVKHTTSSTKNYAIAEAILSLFRD